MMVDRVVEAPNGAHFTTAEPDYRRDEKFQRHYAQAAAEKETWTEFRTPTCPATRPTTRRRCADSQPRHHNDDRCGGITMMTDAEASQ